MLFIDYVALMLANLVFALVLLAVYAAFLIDSDPKRIAPGFLLVGFVAAVTGFGMSFTWPLPGSANLVFGEPSILLGVLFFFTGLSILKEWDLLTMGIGAVIAGVVAIILGIRLLGNVPETQSPVIAGLGYIFAGAGAILMLPTYFFKKSTGWRAITAIVVTIAAVLWAITAIGSYWMHPAAFAKWLPVNHEFLKH